MTQIHTGVKTKLSPGMVNTCCIRSMLSCINLECAVSVFLYSCNINNNKPQPNKEKAQRKNRFYFLKFSMQFIYFDTVRLFFPQTVIVKNNPATPRYTGTYYS